VTVVQGSLGDDQGDFYRITQADQTVTQFSGAVECFDFVPQVAKLAYSPGQAFFIACQSDVMPHDILNGLHITLNEGRIGIFEQAAFVPLWYFLTGGVQVFGAFF